MKTSILLFILFVSAAVMGQESILSRYQSAMNLYQSGRLPEAYQILKDIEQKCDTKDTVYNDILWYCVGSSARLEKMFRDAEKFDSSLHYGLEALSYIQRGLPFFDAKFAAREDWMIKNIIVSYFGLNQIENAEKYKAVLYTAYRDSKLPNGLDKYFNFDFFKLNGKNVWGYEWYPELGDAGTEGSFTKVLYYVYSTNADGTDKDQLYRLHVLKFHTIDDSVKFDYILTARWDNDGHEVSKTLYKYTYSKKIDYLKLRNDIEEVIRNNDKADAEKELKK
jgi:hypothetical protein